MRMTTNKFRVMMEVDKEADKDDQVNREVVIREHLLKKKNVFFRALPELPSPPPLTPFRATCTSFFGRQNRRFARMTEKIPIIIMTVQ